MTFKKLLQLMTLHLFSIPIFAQVFPVKHYPEADSIALQAKYHGDLLQLTRNLTSGLTTHEEKARVIFR